MTRGALRRDDPAARDDRMTGHARSASSKRSEVISS
jgi:hypothetical protein